jgi:hypothetical protein
MLTRIRSSQALASSASRNVAADRHARSSASCFTLDRHSSIQQVSAIPCALPHGTEVYAVVENPAPLDAPYPGVEAVRAYANPTCEAAYEAFVGVPYRPSSRLWISILSPEEPYWVIGVRTAWCSLQARDGEQTTGSARGSGD